MEFRLGRAPVLSPLEESSEEVSRDSGIVSQSTSTLSTVSMISEAASHGDVSQSPSFSGNVLPQSPSFSGNVVPQSPSFSGNVLPQSPSFSGNALPQSPSFSGNVVPQSPSFSGNVVPQSPNFSGNVVPQSPSFPGNVLSSAQTDDKEILRQTALSYSSYIRVDAGEEILCLEKSLEEMLTRVDEFVGMLDMIRSDTSQIVNVSLPQICRKAEDMRQIYRKIDNLETFVKMVAANVSVMEEQVNQAEGEVQTLPGAFKKIFRTLNMPGFLNKPASPKRTPQQHQELPAIFRTEDYFPAQPEQ